MTLVSDDDYPVYLKCSRNGCIVGESEKFHKEMVKKECPECGGGVKEVDALWYFCDDCELASYVTVTAEEKHYLYRACPLCGEDDYFESMHYHHWDYENEAGIHLCRSCHNKVHGGGTVSKQREKGDSDEWVHLAVNNLLEEHKENFDSVIDCPLREQYNIPRRVIGDEELKELHFEVSRVSTERPKSTEIGVDK